MSKTELIQSVVSKTGISQSDVKEVVEATFDSIINSLARGEKVSVTGFGAFEVVEKAEKAFFNPSIGDVDISPAHNVVKFRPFSQLKKIV